jgi:hypothetical protein
MPSLNPAVHQRDSRSVVAAVRHRGRNRPVAVAPVMITLGTSFITMMNTVVPARADPAPLPNPDVSAVCNDAFCTPGITGNVVLGAPCADTSYYVFGTTSWGRLVFCGSPRRYAPRYFRAMPMIGVKELGTNCTGHENAMAQAPDGLFLTCGIQDSQAVWLRGDA